MTSRPARCSRSTPSGGQGHAHRTVPATSWTRSCSATSSRCAPTRPATSTTWSARSSRPAHRRRGRGRPRPGGGRLRHRPARRGRAAGDPERPLPRHGRDLRRGARGCGTTCGMHVHVAIESDEEGVGCLDRIAPWLPVLLAMSTNSPFFDGPGHRLRLLADPALVALAERRPDRGVRVAGGLPARVRPDDRERGGARPGDALLRRPPLGAAPDRRGAGPRRGDRRRRHRPAGGAGARPRRDRGRAVGGRRRAAGLAVRGAARGPVAGLAATACPTSWSTRRPRAAPGPRGGRGAGRPGRRAARRGRRPRPGGGGVERVLAATGATRQRAAYERTGSVEAWSTTCRSTADASSRGPSPSGDERLGSRSWVKRSTHRSSPGPTARATARRSGAASTCSPGCCARRGSTPTTR